MRKYFLIFRNSFFTTFFCLRMPKDAFDPKTFFNLHDLNGDGYWNAEELEALFQMELDKVYNESNPDDDPRER